MFNSKSKEVKRGQAIVPIKFFSGMGAYENMKGSALVRVYQGQKLVLFSSSQTELVLIGLWAAWPELPAS